MRGLQVAEVAQTRVNYLWVSSLCGNLQLIRVLFGDVLHETVVLLVNLKRSCMSLAIATRCQHPT